MRLILPLAADLNVEQNRKPALAARANFIWPDPGEGSGQPEECQLFFKESFAA